MPLNPALRQETLDSPIQRGNPLNDPQFQADQGYNAYELNNDQYCTPRFGEVTPTTVFETVLGDRHRLSQTGFSVLNQLDSRLYSKINAYSDYFYTPLRCIYPINYDKIIPNPTKGDDVPPMALPQIPLMHLVRRLITFPGQLTMYDGDGENLGVISGPTFEVDTPEFVFTLSQLLHASFLLSRGSLLDYLGYQIDLTSRGSKYFSYNRYQNQLQRLIDIFFNSLVPSAGVTDENGIPWVIGMDQLTDIRYNDQIRLPYHTVLNNPSDPAEASAKYAKVVYTPTSANLWTLSGFRAALYDAYEKGLSIFVYWYKIVDGEPVLESPISGDAENLWTELNIMTNRFASDLSDQYAEDYFNSGFINPSRAAAYQLVIADAMTNDTVDNIYTSELYMQNLRAVLFPSDSDGFSTEPTFDYNGVATEYDLLTTGSIYHSFFTDRILYQAQRLPVFLSLLFGLRRSLRYGDYFATGRPNLLAVGSLGIPVVNNTVNPLDTVRQLALQRFLNASNWVGPKFKNYAAAFYGVVPSDIGCHPSFITHYKTELSRDTITNTANNQGAQTTNINGDISSDGFDVYIDDFGIIIGLRSYDALPVYPNGIDRSFQMNDRFSLFNPMLQNIGDQAIQINEITGQLTAAAEQPFAYTVRYAQYKFGLTRAHGAFVNDLPGFTMLYPAAALHDPDGDELKINPDFIRDKPFYFDQFFAQRTGISPAQYYHFQEPIHNQHSAARKMQYQPNLL